MFPNPSLAFMLSCYKEKLGLISSQNRSLYGGYNSIETALQMRKNQAEAWHSPIERLYETPSTYN